MQTLLIDDHALFRDGCKFLLSEFDDSMTFLEAGSIDEALAFIDEPVELVILDYYLPGLQGLDGLDAVRENFSAPVVMLSMEENAAVIRSVIDRGASGFVPKSATHQMLELAVQSALSGGIFTPRNQVSDPGPLARLTKRQLQTLSRAALGRSNKMIARELSIAEGTVKAHLSFAFKTLEVSNRTEAAAMLTKLGHKLTESE